MRVRLLYFGVLKELLGAAEGAVELEDGATVGWLLEDLRARTSNSGMGNVVEDGARDRLWRGLAVAVNRQYCSPSQILSEGDEVALLPPVSGGCCGATRTAKGSFRSLRLFGELPDAG
jgi:molybdopterin converting factor small subunit